MFNLPYKIIHKQKCGHLGMIPVLNHHPFVTSRRDVTTIYPKLWSKMELATILNHENMVYSIMVKKILEHGVNNLIWLTILESHIVGFISVVKKKVNPMP